MSLMNYDSDYKMLYVCIVLMLITTWRAATASTWPNRALSSVMHTYLVRRYAIVSSDGLSVIPSCRYQFPNGQGNEMKFFSGEANAREWRNHYGGIYRIWAGSCSEVVLTRQDQVQTVFKDSNRHIKGENMDSGWLLSQILGKCIGLLNQDQWDRCHRVFNQYFHRETALSYLPLLDERVRMHFAKAELDGSNKSDQYVLRTSEDLKLLAFHAMGNILYGQLSETLEKQLQDIVMVREDLWQKCMRGGFSRFSLSKYFPTSTNCKLRNFQRKWRQFNMDAARNARHKNVNAPIVSLFEAVDSGHISETELLHTVDEILFANLDVTVGNFSWNPVFLAVDQETQRELHTEISSITTQSVCREDFYQYISRRDTLLMACIQESARLKPMAAFSLAQAAPTDRLIDDFVVPAGTNFMVDSYALNVLDPAWGEDRLLYRPRRFLDSRQAMSNHRYRFWRYGFGPRQCLGKNVADLLLKLMLAYMVEKFELHLASDDVEEPEEWKRESTSWISLSAQDIVCTKREVLDFR